MQLRHLKSILPANEGMQKVTALAWSTNSRRLAAVTTDRIVHLFDENGDRKDKFSTKPAEPKGPRTYLVRGMAFSPDSAKLAVAQSDNIVFIYKLGYDWGDKKSICNKFHQSTAITCVTWPSQHHHEVVFGLLEGKVKVGQLRNNKAGTLYTHPEGSAVVALTSSPEGNAILSCHMDRSIYRFVFDDGAVGSVAIKLAQHASYVVHNNPGCVPMAISWGDSIVVAGNDCKVVFYSKDGGNQQQFDYSGDETIREFTAACFNASGDTVIVGSFNRFHVFSFHNQRGVWEEVAVKNIENLYTITACSWRPDGSRLTLGGLCGSVDLYDACIRRHRYKGKFEFTYVSKSQVIVKRLSSNARIALKSHFGNEIIKVNIYHDQYLIAHTAETLLMGDLETCKLSEVPWTGSGNERFILDHPAVCMVYNVGELSLIEYGSNEILGTCRTEHVSPYLISVRLNDSRPKTFSAEDNKKMAYLIDLQTIRVLDLCSGVTVATINHDSKIDWLELNPRASHLLYRDKKRQLHLFNIVTQERVSLLNYCSYVQWVPDSDVIVAQNRGNLCVWYSLANAERVTIFPIKGDVEDIERTKGHTEIIVDEGINTVSYALDESLIEFGSAVEDRDYDRAVDILEPLELTPETEAMWQQLSAIALEERQLGIAERCYAALGDVAKARFLQKVNHLKEEAEKETGGDGINHYMVKANLAMLQRQWKVAETLLLEQGRINDVIQMYTECHRWKEAIRVAETKGHPDAETLRRNHYQWLLQTGQEEEAGAVKEREGDYLGAIALYLKGGLPGKAAHCVSSNSHYPFKPELLESIAATLSHAGMHEKAGDFFEKLGMNERAKEAYRRGHAYRRAVELARRVFPGEVVALEEEWGDWLVSQKQVDAAINHFIEAGSSVKAIEAAIASRQWAKAVQIVEAQDAKVALPFCKRIARHYESAKNYEEAETFFIRAKLPGEAVEMYTRAKRWEAALKVAARYMSESEANMLYLRRARELEASGRLKEAEKMFIEVKEYDLAIKMYKKAHMYDHMIRLVATYRKDSLLETHLRLAQQLEKDGMLREAEHHYVEAKDWKSAVQMYRVNNMWDEAIRVAKLYGGISASKQVAYAWAVSLGGEAGALLLTRFGLMEQAVDYAIESGAFNHAFELCHISLKQKLPEVHLKYAMYLEDEGRFKEAEEEFIKADKPREAIDMYIHQQDWASATHVAEAYDPSSISDIQVAQARLMIGLKEYAKAEALFLKAKHPELAIRMYKDLSRWDDAIRVAEDYLPSKLPEIHAEVAASMRSENNGQDTTESIIAHAKAFERSRDFSHAIDAYLRMTKENTADVDYLQHVWDMAVKLAMNNAPEKIPEVVAMVSKRLIDLGHFVQAAQLYQSIDSHREAIDVYILGGLWEEARALGNAASQKLSQYVEGLYKEHLMANEEADQLIQSGNILEGLELYARQHDWQKVHNLASLQGPEVAAKYAARHAKHCIQMGEIAEAVGVLLQNGVSTNPAYFDLYKHICHELISGLNDDVQMERAAQDLRTILLKLTSALRSVSNTNSAALREFERLAMIIHYVTLRSTCKKKGLHEIAAKLSISLLRFVGLIPADKAFFMAGQACREVGWLNMAFVFLNRYLDLAEAMEDPENVVIENSDFVKTDIPSDFAIPEKHFLPEDTREAVRDWVLELSMDKQVEQALNMKKCDKCLLEHYEASLVCPSCKEESKPCIVTGYGVLKSQHISCKVCGMPANNEDWNKFVLVSQKCPWCSSHQGPIY